jgi:hypothetical protein
MCACARVCVCAHARVCACVCVRVCVLIQFLFPPPDWVRTLRAGGDGGADARQAGDVREPVARHAATAKPALRGVRREKSTAGAAVPVGAGPCAGSARGGGEGDYGRQVGESEAEDAAAHAVAARIQLKADG